MANIPFNRGSTVSQVLSLDDLVGLIVLEFDPTIGGFDAPIGSLGMRTNGIHYRKIGVGATAWAETDTGGGGATTISVILEDGTTPCNVETQPLIVILEDGATPCTVL